MGRLTVFLLCHNRPKLAVEAIKSILNQTDNTFRFIVSDNSSNKDLQGILKDDFPSIEYISWFPGVPVFEHFRKVISLVDTSYFVMFHDDDLMEPDFVRRIKEQFRSTPSAAAIGTNAYLIDRGGKNIGSQLAFMSRHRIDFFTNKNKFILHYLAGDFGGVSPFCSYAYNAKLIQGLFPDYSRARNYCDTLFLAEILSRGPIIWINEPLIRTRVHEDNLSYFSGVGDYKAFITFVRREFGHKIDQRYIDEYRFLRLFVALERSNRLRKGRIPAPALMFFIRIFPKLMIYSRSFRKRVWNKLLQIILP